MPKILILILLLISLILSESTAQEHKSVLTAPENWQSEIIPFPLDFAPAIDFVGIEELRFAPSWSDSTNRNFWTYTFVWYIDENTPMTEDILTKSFNSYYDGLMKIEFLNRVDTSMTNQVDHTLCLFVKTEEGFTGKMRMYDNFFLKDNMTLNIKVRESFCPKTNKQIVFCDISKQSFDHQVWKLFDDVKLIVKCQ
jgi:hypothetical protein